MPSKMLATAASGTVGEDRFNLTRALEASLFVYLKREQRVSG